MSPDQYGANDSLTGAGTSRRSLLRAIAAAPAVAAAPWGEALTPLYESYGDAAATVVRSREGRAFSRQRYHVAEGFFPTEQPQGRLAWQTFLYRSGIAAQLALSSHLLDIGFTDEWCARNIGLRVAKSLAYANATGLGHNCPEMARLALVLTPYHRWNQVRPSGQSEPDDGGFTPAQVRVCLRALLDRVHDVTGHPRPRGWERRL
ncbi:hypothetical protein [Erythrobacter sp. SG61-1L]|uniref:hypothetical protein n=1 Tax=Erythrobacter sp. SG61-1L TaxID=1603897 RepID=UPI0009EC4D59|nr:hypothetical protein [Erythrobacter sp. SG61-1L]